MCRSNLAPKLHSSHSLVVLAVYSYYAKSTQSKDQQKLGQLELKTGQGDYQALVDLVEYLRFSILPNVS